MEIQEHVLLKSKTTMRIGGEARFFAEVSSKEELEKVTLFSKKEELPLVVLGGGSNTIFCDELLEAVVVKIGAREVTVDGNTVMAESGAYLASLINTLAEHNLDLSALTGIPGSVGGAIFGNAGQGPTGVWIDSFIEEVEVYDGTWRVLGKEECGFGYRESGFKSGEVRTCLPARQGAKCEVDPIIWSVKLTVPSRPEGEIREEIEHLIQKRIETQPHVKTAGSCFKAVGGTPAWKLIHRAGLRGAEFGGVVISEKHSNFLLNNGSATYEDACRAVDDIRDSLDAELDVEMRFIEPDGELRY